MLLCFYVFYGFYGLYAARAFPTTFMLSFAKISYFCYFLISPTFFASILFLHIQFIFIFHFFPISSQNAFALLQFFGLVEIGYWYVQHLIIKTLWSFHEALICCRGRDAEPEWISRVLHNALKYSQYSCGWCLPRINGAVQQQRVEGEFLLHFVFFFCRLKYFLLKLIEGMGSVFEWLALQIVKSFELFIVHTIHLYSLI